MVGGRASRAEHGHGRADTPQPVEPDRELGRDVTDPVGIRDSVRGGLVSEPEEQLLVECR
jgi:hypothetical protein